MRIGLTTILTLFLAGTILSSPAEAYTIEELPIQDGGRQKPFLTYAQEMLRTLHGKTTLKVESSVKTSEADGGTEAEGSEGSNFLGKTKAALKDFATKGSEGEKKKAREAIKVVATWFLMPEQWDESPFLIVDHHGLKEALGFEKTQKYFSFKELMSHPRVNTLFTDLGGRLAKKEKLNPFYQAVQRMQFQFQTYMAFRQGGTRVLPAEDGEKRNGTWLALGEMDAEKRGQFQEIMGQYILSFVGEDQAVKDKAAVNLQAALDRFTKMATSVPGAVYPSEKMMATEVMYQKFHPFMWTWILYLASAIFLGLAHLFMPVLFTRLGLGLAGLAFGLHTVGFALRVMITSRPPVSNMYETVIWVAWGCMLFAGLFYFIKRKKLIPIAGAIVATVCMVIADRAPVILDPTLQPLEPVLRSNMWLIIHVMTITLSYAAFFLAMGVGDYGMYLWVTNEKGRKKDIRELAQICYQLIQVGVVLLAAGTILGGVWADYSWGRFWGWDPKETWAFIALMGYLALLHARLTGWVKDFGMLAGSIIAFSLVIMAWYGVNYILGTGLHSYGFGAGGIEYVVSFVGAHLVLVGYAAMISKSPFKSA